MRAALLVAVFMRRSDHQDPCGSWRGCAMAVKARRLGAVVCPA